MPPIPRFLPLWTLLGSLTAWSAGCSAFWPTVVRTSPNDPLFHSGFPLVGGARLDGALCSLATVGPEAMLVVDRPEPTNGAVPVQRACYGAIPVSSPEHGRIGQLVSVETELGPAYGYLYTAPAARGLLVAFSGLGMPPAGWINERFAELAAQRELMTFAPVRDETARPIYFDPLREARRALAAALEIQAACHVDTSPEIHFVGISMGGLEALLANREALGRKVSARAAVLDPVLDFERVTENLDSFWHSAAVDSMQAYFRRILRGRYQEPPSTTFREVMGRLGSHADAVTNPRADAPSAWLCSAKPDAYAVFLSDTDPVLGDDQRKFARDCGFPVKPAGAPGHTPLACRLKLFEEIIEQVAPKPVRNEHAAIASSASGLPGCRTSTGSCSTQR